MKICLIRLKKVIIFLWHPVVTPVTTGLSEDYIALTAASLVVSAPTDRQSRLRYWLLFIQLSFSHLSSVIWERERQNGSGDRWCTDTSVINHASSNGRGGDNSSLFWDMSFRGGMTKSIRSTKVELQLLRLTKLDDYYKPIIIRTL